MKEIIDQLKDLKKKLKELEVKIDFSGKESEIKSLAGEMNEPGFWQNQQRATWLSKKVADLKSELANWENLKKEVADLLLLAKEDDQDQSVSLNQEILDQYHQLKRTFNKIEMLSLMSDKYDSLNTVISIYAGAGGDDAQDWAEMLLRMYLRYVENKGWQANIIDQSKGGEAGIKSVSVEIKGNYAFGFLKAEAGVHRLVRLSPFDADHARHTSFALVEVIPEIEQETEIAIKPDELKIDVFRASGHGGQSVNTTDSAVRITHLPTGIKVVCQNERSQLQNKETALKYLKGKLTKYFEAKLEEERQALRGQFTEASWGNQIRSYVLHPYKMVKDHRTGYEESNPDKVLDGDLENFIQHLLISSKSGSSNT